MKDTTCELWADQKSEKLWLKSLSLYQVIWADFCFDLTWSTHWHHAVSFVDWIEDYVTQKMKHQHGSWIAKQRRSIHGC